MKTHTNSGRGMSRRSFIKKSSLATVSTAAVLSGIVNTHARGYLPPYAHEGARCTYEIGGTWYLDPAVDEDGGNSCWLVGEQTNANGVTFEVACGVRSCPGPNDLDEHAVPGHTFFDCLEREARGQLPLCVSLA